MNLTLKRVSCDQHGVFSELVLENGETFCYGAEHSYQQPDGSWAPKIPDGTFTCVRGMHRLESMKVPFETYEITGVVGHSDLLFHVGNFPQVDSSGCCLLGSAIASYQMTGKMVTASKQTFAEFLLLQKDLDSFILTVV